ncbi:MAG: ATP-binding protein [bacterium]
MYFRRQIQSRIEKSFFTGRAIIIYGPRQVGKTTLLKNMLESHKDKAIYLNCDEPDIKLALTEKTSTELRLLIGENKIVAIDEAQRVKNIGLTIKLIVDTYPEIQVIATGSSSFELSNIVKEPLTGRKIEFHLYPISLSELNQAYSRIELSRIIENLLRFGSYPKVLTSPLTEMAQIINEVSESYLYKDILEYQQLKKTDLLQKLLQALALQVGSNVAYSELANLLKVDKDTIERYVKLLEQSFIIFVLPPFSRNLRKEIGKTRKIYFWDTGIRNSIINNFNPINLRNDIGMLWENFVISERMKSNSNHGTSVNYYFWRTYDKKEIDLIEDANGLINGYEIKWKKDKYSPPKEFLNAYTASSVKLINKDNFLDFLG